MNTFNAEFSFRKVCLLFLLLAPALESTPQRRSQSNRGRGANRAPSAAVPVADYEYYDYGADPAIETPAADECILDVGPLVRTQHQVSGNVCVVDIRNIKIEGFTFDGLGAGVFINIATEGRNRRQWIQSRQIVPYPSVQDSRPIETRYNGNKSLNITLPVDVTEVKWLSVWCEIFGISFGEVRFPKIVAQ